MGKGKEINQRSSALTLGFEALPFSWPVSLASLRLPLFRVLALSLILHPANQTAP